MQSNDSAMGDPGPLGLGAPAKREIVCGLAARESMTDKLTLASDYVANVSSIGILNIDDWRIR